MKYWLLTTEYPPLHGGGISTYCFFTAQMLAQAGMQVTVFINDDSINDFIVTDEKKGIRVIRFNTDRDNLNKVLGYTAKLSYAFATIVKQIIEQDGKPDFIEAQDYLGIAYYLTQFKHAGYSFLSDLPILITIHSPAFIYLAYNKVPVYCYPDFWTGEMEKQSITAADALIAPSFFIIKEIESYISLATKKITVIANPYQKHAIKDIVFERNRIVYYGKLSPQKGSFALLTYFKVLWDEGFPYPLHIIGGTDIVYHPEQQTMGQLIEKKYATYIQQGLLKLHGKIKPQQIERYLKDAHVVIVPSIVDNLPYIVMEAMSLGKVVLVSKQGGQNEMIEEGVSGFSFDHDIPATFAEQLKKIVLLDDETIQQIGLNAREQIEKLYSFDVIAAQKINFLKTIQSNKTRQDYFPFLHQQEMIPIAGTGAAKGLLSVVIPYFNMGNYIDDCLQSINNSSYKNIEIIIINDGSIDRQSIDKLNTLRNNNELIIIDRKNAGLAATRNFGASIAKGQFLAFLDADDKVAPAYYHKAIHALERNKNVFFIGAWTQYFENSNTLWPAFTPQPPYALVHNPVNSSALVYKKDAFWAAGLNDADTGYVMEDYESVINMLHNGLNGIVLPEVLFYYRVRSGSMFRNVTKEKLVYSNRYIAEKHAAYYSKFATSVINLLNANGPGYLYDNPTFKVTVSSKSTIERTIVTKLKNFIKRNEQFKKIALTLKNKLSL